VPPASPVTRMRAEIEEQPRALRAMGLSFADLLHGPIAVVDARTPAVIMAADCGPTLDGAVALAGWVSAAGGRPGSAGPAAGRGRLRSQTWLLRFRRCAV